MERLLLRPVEVAELLGIGRSRAYELIGSGVVPAIRIGSSVRVPVDSLKAWVDSQADETAKSELSRRLK
jgi:excisionase family DNA binding protein